MKREEVLRILHNHAIELVEQFGLAALYLFGSVARGKTHSESDVDLLVEFAQPLDCFGSSNFTNGWKRCWDARSTWVPCDP